MEENMILEESVMEEIKEETQEEILPKIQPRKNKKEFKEKTCDVIAYNKRNKTLDVRFDGYGIRIKNVEDFNDSVAVIKYKGEIGKPNFEYKL